MRIDDPILDREEEITGIEEYTEVNSTTVIFEVVKPSKGGGLINFFRKVFGG